MSGLLLAHGLLGFSFCACLLAFVRGGAAERTGAAIILANLVAGMANESFLKDQLVTLAIDALTALALLPVTMRYVSVWLGAVMILYGMQFALHAYYAVLSLQRDNLHVVLNNTDFFAINACLVAATVMTWMRRRRAAAPTAGAAPDAPRS